MTQCVEHSLSDHKVRCVQWKVIHKYWVSYVEILRVHLKERVGQEEEWVRSRGVSGVGVGQEGWVRRRGGSGGVCQE